MCMNVKVHGVMLSRVRFIRLFFSLTVYVLNTLFLSEASLLHVIFIGLDLQQIEILQILLIFLGYLKKL